MKRKVYSSYIKIIEWLKCIYWTRRWAANRKANRVKVVPAALSVSFENVPADAGVDYDKDGEKDNAL
jgi:hypothetical protein